MSRLRYIVSYDIANPKRLRRVAKLMESFGTRIQYSVFECALDDLKLEQLKAEARLLLKTDEDQVLIISLGPSAKDATLVIDSLGKPYLVRSRVTIV